MKRKKHNLILLTKIQSPQIRAKTLKRKHLIDLLTRNLNKKVILLCAGAGYGKTTLLSQLISRKKISYVYYHLEKSDAEPAVFFSYLIAGIQMIIPEFGKKTLGISHFFNYPQKYLEIIVGTFINEIIESVNKDLFIILEDYHALESSATINRILDYLLGHLPQNLHFIITSRTTPALVLSQLRARNEIFELDSQQLKFTRDEIAQLLEKLYSISLKEPELAWLEKHSEGWPTSLRLMLESFDYCGGIETSQCISKIQESYYKTQTNLFRYFTQEIYNRESDEIKQFLIDCSILEWLMPELCDAVTLRKNSADILFDLSSRNVFVSPITGFDYRFHTLFQDFLYSKFTDKDREKRLCRRAGDFYAKEYRYESAVKFYLQAEGYKKVTSIVEKMGLNLIEQGKSAALCAYIEKIPNSIRIQRPKCLMYYAQSLTYIGNFEEAEKIYFRLVKILRHSRQKGEYARVLLGLGLLNLEQSAWDNARRLLRKALRVCPKGQNLIRANIMSPLGLIYTYRRNFSKAAKYYEEAYKIAHKNRDRNLEASVLNNLAMNELSAGNLNQAYSKLSKMVDILKERFDINCGSGFFNASKISLLLGRKDEARTILDCGLKICSSYNDLYSMAEIWRGYALLYTELADIKKAKENILKSLDVYKKIGIRRFIIAALHIFCRINIAAKELNNAEKNLSEIWELKKNRNDIEAISILLTEAKLQIAKRKFNMAAKILLEALKITQMFKQIFDTFLIYIELSKVFYYQGKIQKALSSLKESVKISRLKGYDYLLLKELQEENWMLDLIKRNNIESRYTTSILKESITDLHKIEASLFGIPSVFIDNCKIKDDAWKTVKAKKLFFYLLLHKNEHVSNDFLIDTFWKNVSIRSGKYNLRKAIYNIRQAFAANIAGIGDVIFSSRGFYRITQQIPIELDIEKFQNLIVQTRTQKKPDEELKSNLQEAISLYKTGFAIGWYDDWIEDLCLYYKGLYEECLGMTADLYFKENEFKEAIVWYKKQLSLNFYNEEYHRKLMICFAKLGKYKELTQTFEKIKNVLSKEVGTKPQQETIDLYKALIH